MGSIWRDRAAGALGKDARDLIITKTEQTRIENRHTSPVDACSAPDAGGWRSLKAVEFATLEWVEWFTTRRLLEPIGNIPPAEA